MPRQVTEAEINDFLESKPNIQISTIDPEGYPYNSALMVPLRKITRQDIFGTQKMRRKVQNILTNHDKVYFSIDDESYQYRGVKGKAIALISEDIQKNLSTIKQINMKYLGTLEHPLAKMILENTKKGTEVVIEIAPKFFSAWDFKSK